MYVRVIGNLPEHEVSHDFLRSGNRFVLYVDERKDYFCTSMQETITKFVVSGWDVLYPVYQVAPITDTPNYVLKSDFDRTWTDPGLNLSLLYKNMLLIYFLILIILIFRDIRDKRYQKTEILNSYAFPFEKQNCREKI